MQIEQFAAITSNVIREQGIGGFQPTVCFPERRDIRALSGVPEDEAHEPIALRWAASLANPGEAYLVAFKHSETQFKVVHCVLGNQEHQVFQTPLAEHDLLALLPSTKRETETAEHLVALGYPAVAPVLPQMLEWVQDLNWPVARVFQPFLTSIGAPLAPFVRRVLATTDDAWKYSLLTGVVDSSPDLARALQQDLERLVRSPTPGEVAEEVSEVAADVLRSLPG